MVDYDRNAYFFEPAMLVLDMYLDILGVIDVIDIEDVKVGIDIGGVSFDRSQHRHGLYLADTCVVEVRSFNSCP